MFAQYSIKPQDVFNEVMAMQNAIGLSVDVEKFVIDTLKAHGASIDKKSNSNSYEINLSECPKPLQESIGYSDNINVSFTLPVTAPVKYLNRTHQIVDGLSQFIINEALDSITAGYAKRAGVIRTKSVSKRTTILLMRCRYHLLVTKGEIEQPLLCEDSMLLGFEGSPDNPQWIIDTEQLENLLTASPDVNIDSVQGSDFIAKVNNNINFLQNHIDSKVIERGKEIQKAHERVRASAAQKGIKFNIEPKLPADIIGIYVYLPVLNADNL